MKGICAYIDILGFTNYVNENRRGAIMLLQNYQVQLQQLGDFLQEDNYTIPYQQNSFKYLIPFSDSIFFYSEKPSEFVMQLSNFINESFSLTSHVYTNPEDPEHPENVTERGVAIEGGKMIVKDFPAKWFPLLFRGGIGYGDASVMQLNCIHDGGLSKTPFVFGNSVIDAVKMETLSLQGEKLKGPRILCTKDLFNELNERAKKIVHPAFDMPGYYEVNWTAVHYLMTDSLNDYNVNNLLINDFYLNMLTPATGLWKAFEKSTSSLHYKNFLKLIVRGVQHYFIGTEFHTKVNSRVKDYLEKEGLSNLTEYLMSEIEYKIGKPETFLEEERNMFLDLLKLQGRVSHPTIEKINRCSLLCICKVDNKIVSIGAIKPKTESDFSIDKADLASLSNEFIFELGYCFTLSKHTKKGYCSTIVNFLISALKVENLMASTELRGENSMKKILENFGFKQFGKTWQSSIDGGDLGLFLRFGRRYQ